MKPSIVATQPGDTALIPRMLSIKIVVVRAYSKKPDSMAYTKNSDSVTWQPATMAIIFVECNVF